MSNPSHNGGDSRKQAVSIRMNRGDVRNVKCLAERLGTRESDVIRYAVKLMLAKLALLQDPSARGRSLVPLFIESGPELIRHFELDFAKLSTIINDGVSPEQSVDPADVQLIAMNGLQRAYVKLRVAGLRRAQESSARSTGIEIDQFLKDHAFHDEDALDQSLRQYLYDKYLYPDESGAASPINKVAVGGGS